jgi:hypothetical protein
MKISILYIRVLGSKSDANVKDLSDATNAYLAKKGQLCLGISTKWPVDLQDSDQRTGNVKASEMAALEKVGLVDSQSTEAEYTTLSGRPAKAKVLRYELTDEGRKFYREKDVVAARWVFLHFKSNEQSGKTLFVFRANILSSALVVATGSHLRHFGRKPPRMLPPHGLLLVVLDNFGWAHFRLVRIIAKLSKCPALAQEIPTLI